jgi:membrane protein implicated in regulation of membrane protease activity
MAYWAWLLLGGAPGDRARDARRLLRVLLRAHRAARGAAGRARLGRAGLDAWLLFSAISIALLGLLRRPLQSWLESKRRSQPVDMHPWARRRGAGRTSAIGALGKGRQLRGASWTARNGGASAIVKGQRLRVDRVEGLTLHVHTE